MNLKTILFKLGLRKVRYGDAISIEESNDSMKKVYLIIGKPFYIENDKNNKQKYKQVVAVWSKKGGIVKQSDCRYYRINLECLGRTFRLINIKDIIEVW